MQLLYMGFDQAKNIREYKFDGVAKDDPTTHFVVSADLALFAMYHVGLQEGPALCLKKLSADLEMLQPLPHELTSRDLAAYVSAQAAAAEAAAAKRKATRKRRHTGRPEYYTYLGRRADH
jgi:hypothetical protein